MKGRCIESFTTNRIAVLSTALSACSNSTQSLPATGSVANSAAGISSSLASWRNALAQNKLPGAGCFRATYPSTQWQRVACTKPPHIWYPLPRSRRPNIGPLVGDGNDFTADTTPNLISMAIGAFPKVKGVKTVESGGSMDAYSLQLNSNFFETVACGTLQDCVGWSQFVYENPPGLEPRNAVHSGLAGRHESVRL